MSCVLFSLLSTTIDHKETEKATYVGDTNEIGKFLLFIACVGPVFWMPMPYRI